MRKYIFVSIGAMLGALLRFMIRELHIWNNYGIFPMDTFFINITGSFILVFFLTISLEIFEFDADIRLGISTGFFGAFTTFSAFCKEIVVLMSSNKYFMASLYMALSLFMGLFAAYLGYVLAKITINKLIKNETNNIVLEHFQEREPE